MMALPSRGALGLFFLVFLCGGGGEFGGCGWCAALGPRRLASLSSGYSAPLPTSEYPQWPFFGYSGSHSFSSMWNWTIGTGDVSDGDKCSGSLSIAHKDVLDANETAGIWAQCSPIVDHLGEALVYWVDAGNRTIRSKVCGTRYAYDKHSHHKVSCRGLVRWNLTDNLEYALGGDSGNDPARWGWQAALMRHPNSTLLIPMTVRNASHSGGLGGSPSCLVVALPTRPHHIDGDRTNVLHHDNNRDRDDGDDDDDDDDKGLWVTPSWTYLFNCTASPCVVPVASDSSSALFQCGGSGNDAGIHLLNATDGRALWHFRPNASVEHPDAWDTPPSVSSAMNAWAWVGASSIFRINVSNGESRWNHTIPLSSATTLDSSRLPLVLNDELDLVIAAIGSSVHTIVNASAERPAAIATSFNGSISSISAIGSPARGVYVLSHSGASVVLRWNRTEWIAVPLHREGSSLSGTIGTPVSSMNSIVFSLSMMGADALSLIVSDYSRAVHSNGIDGDDVKSCHSQVSSTSRPLTSINGTQQFVSPRWYSAALTKTQLVGLYSSASQVNGSGRPALFIALDKSENNNPQARTIWIIVAAVAGFIVIIAPILLSVIGVLVLRRAYAFFSKRNQGSVAYMPLETTAASSGYSQYDAEYDEDASEHHSMAEPLWNDEKDHHRHLHLSFGTEELQVVRGLFRPVEMQRYFIASDELWMGGISHRWMDEVVWDATWNARGGAFAPSSSSASPPASSPPPRSVPHNTRVSMREVDDVVVTPGLVGTSKLLCATVQHRMDEVVGVAHENIQSVLGVTHSSNGTGLAMVCERVDGRFVAGSLEDVLCSPTRNDVHTMHRLLLDVAHALAHLHRQGVVHGHVHPRNVLVHTSRSPTAGCGRGSAPRGVRGVLGALGAPLMECQRTIKRAMADAVVAAIAHQQGRDALHSGLEGTIAPQHMPAIDAAVVEAMQGPAWPMLRDHATHRLPRCAPELLDGRASQCTPATDVYAFGMLIWDVLTQGDVVPFEGLNPEMMAAEIARGTRPFIGEKVDKTGMLYEIMQQCWHADEDGRPSAEEICEMLDDCESMGATAWRWWHSTV